MYSPTISRTPYLRAASLLLAALLSWLFIGVAISGATDVIGGLPPTASTVSTVVGPEVSMPAGILVSLDGRELWSRNADERRAMASVTKIMTAVVALENASLDDEVKVSARAVAIGESAAGLKPGDTLSVREILEAMLVKSGNEAAEALAEQIAGSTEAYVGMMNDKAVELGLEDTHFTNPHGLTAPRHYASARDLSVLARYAMANDEFRRIVGLESVDVDGPGGNSPLANSNLLIGSYDGATGIKTGWTSQAGYCLAASAKRDEIELVAIVLGTSDENARFTQARSLLDWGFTTYAMQRLTAPGESLGVVPVKDYLDRVVPAVTADEVRVPVFAGDGDIVRSVDLYPAVDAPVAPGDRIGTLSVTQGERLLASVPLVSSVDVEKPDVFEQIWIMLVRGWRSVFGGQLVAEPVSA
jgi:D-alanyl-D-alanine carboxypeptidase (penicillin-binding protein 5/6)